MRIDLGRGESPLVIAVQNNNGILVPIQGLEQFLYGDRDLRILCYLHGRALFDILYDDHGLIRYDENRLVLSQIIELNTNRLALYCAQHGCCAVTKQPMEVGDIHCHHKVPRKQGGSDRYSNLVLVKENVHILIHATDAEVIRHYVEILKLTAKEKEKVNSLRKKARLSEI